MPQYPGLLVYGGDIISADDLNANIPAVYTKGLATNRISTTTYSADDELVNIPLDVGTYEIELVLYFTVASVTPKMKTRWIFTGSWNNPIRACIGPSGNQTAVPTQITEPAMVGYNADTGDSLYNGAISALFAVVREQSREVIVTTAGTMALHFSQVVSTASNITVQPGTHFIIRKISN